MTKPARGLPTKKRHAAGISHLRARLEEAEQAIKAIRAGDVDTLIMSGLGGERVFTLEGADRGYRTLLEVMSEGVAKLSQQGLITYCNARFAAILGMALEQTMGSSIHDRVIPAERERFAALLTAGLRERSEGEFELRGESATTVVPVLLSVVPLTMESAERQCLVMTDLTEQRRHADAIAVERAAMQERLLLADRMASMGTLAAGVAHEINNPLAYVIASLELMVGRLPEIAAGTGGTLDEQVAWLRRMLERATEGSGRVRVIVRDLKAFSRADDETVEVVDLRRALDTSIDLASNEIRHRARLVRDYDGVPSAYANAARLGQVFVNLLVNAAHAIPQGATDRNEIHVTGHADAGGNAVIEIKDTGTGISAENLSHIFEPFFTTKAVGAGTGLGLSLCHGIIASLGGRITAESSPGAGSLFRIWLPAPPATKSDDAVVLPLPVAASRGRLLIVDDEVDLCAVFQESFAPFLDVTTTIDAHEALRWIAAGKSFDMILCDMKMPEMTGVNFYSQVLLLNPDQASRVVLMSGGFRRHAGELSVVLPNPILEKPFQIETVRALMREALERGAASAAPMLGEPTRADAGVREGLLL